MDTFAQALEKMLAPMLYADAENHDALHKFLTALGEVFQLVEDYASDTDEVRSKPGYSLWIDIDRVPDEAIPWLGQFVGVKVTEGLPPEAQRQQVLSMGNWQRGTVKAIKDAPAPFLSGTQTVIVTERDTSPYHFRVVTYADETLDQARVTAALIAAKPAGLVMNYIVYAGQAAFTMRNSAIRGTPADAVRLVVF